MINQDGVTIESGLSADTTWEIAHIIKYDFIIITKTSYLISMVEILLSKHHSHIACDFISDWLKYKSHFSLILQFTRHGSPIC